MDAHPSRDADPQPRWVEVSLRVPSAWDELAAELLGRPPASPAALQAGGESTLVRSWLPADAATPAWLSDLTRRLEDALTAAGCPAGGARPELREVDPAELRAPRWRAFRVGRVCIVPPGDDVTLRADDVCLRLEPGAAFGTGRHGTTRTCLRALQRLPLRAARVLDAGCGTGLLGLAAARLGAGTATLLDDDPVATDCARELVRAHDLQATCRVVTGDLASAADEPPHDVLIANLEGPLLLERAAELAALLRVGGAFVVSGIKAGEEARVAAALERAGLRTERSQGTPTWRTLTGTRAAHVAG